MAVKRVETKLFLLREQPIVFCKVSQLVSKMFTVEIHIGGAAVRPGPKKATRVHDPLTQCEISCRAFKVCDLCRKQLHTSHSRYRVIAVLSERPHKSRANKVIQFGKSGERQLSNIFKNE